jgi:hypothetical protein
VPNGQSGTVTGRLVSGSVPSSLLSGDCDPRIHRSRPRIGGVAALGIVRAADERAEFARFEAQAAGVAGRAGARIRAVLLGREDVRAQKLVHLLQNFGDAQPWSVDRRREILPVAEHLLPIELGVRDQVELPRSAVKPYST